MEGNVSAVLMVEEEEDDDEKGEVSEVVEIETR